MLWRPRSLHHGSHVQYYEMKLKWTYIHFGSASLPKNIHSSDDSTSIWEFYVSLLYQIVPVLQ